MINWGNILIWGLIATTLLSVLEAAGRALGLTRISIHFLVGTMFTASRERAGVVGIIVHMLNGWIAAIGYALVFEQLNAASWWSGGLLGLLHGCFVLALIIPVMPSFHPRMAAETDGPAPTPMLQPPGFMALNYGRGTAMVTLIAHIAYGSLLGALYQVN